MVIWLGEALNGHQVHFKNKEARYLKVCHVIQPSRLLFILPYFFGNFRTEKTFNLFKQLTEETPLPKLGANKNILWVYVYIALLLILWTNPQCSVRVGE